MESSQPKRRFPPPWTVEKRGDDVLEIKDANGMKLASVYYREDMQRWTFGGSYLSADEARRIARAIARLPELLNARQRFAFRGSGKRWRRERPYHVAISSMYLQSHWFEMDALCRFNYVPFDATGERFSAPSGVWCVYEFARQDDAIMFWQQFDGRWMHGDEFIFPECTADLPRMKMPADWHKAVPKPRRG